MKRSEPGMFIRFFFSALLIIFLTTEPVTAGGNGKSDNALSPLEEKTDEEPRPKGLKPASESESCEPPADTEITEPPVCQLFRKARSWNWHSFNWMVLHNLFPQLTPEQYLHATQLGGWQNIGSLATALVHTSQVSNYNEGLFLVFTALSHSQQTTHLYTLGNNHLLQQMTHDLEGLDIGLHPQPHSGITLPVVPDEDKVRESSVLLGILAGNASLMCIRLKNRLSDLLRVLEKKLGISLTPGVSAKAEERPKLLELISLIPESHQQQALAILIAFPFEQYTLGASASPFMAPENPLREQVAMILAQLWHRHPEYRQQLILLALHVVYLNFLDNYPTPDMASGHQPALQQLVAMTINHDINLGRIMAEKPENRILRIHCFDITKVLTDKWVRNELLRKLASKKIISADYKLPDSMDDFSLGNYLYDVIHTTVTVHAEPRKALYTIIDIFDEIAELRSLASKMHTELQTSDSINQISNSIFGSLLTGWGGPSL